jgi:hypothetical protein
MAKPKPIPAPKALLRLMQGNLRFAKSRSTGLLAVHQNARKLMLKSRGPFAKNIAKKARALTASFIRKWNEQAVRAAEIERLQALERARLGERIPWADSRWYL